MLREVEQKKESDADERVNFESYWTTKVFA